MAPSHSQQTQIYLKPKERGAALGGRGMWWNAIKQLASFMDWPARATTNVPQVLNHRKRRPPPHGNTLFVF